MLRSLYERVLALAGGPYAIFALPLVAFIEATFPFVPPDVMLAPMVLARPERGWFYAAVCTLGSVTGGCAGYALGFFFSGVAIKLLTVTGHPGALAGFQALFAKVGLAVILIKGLTPVPYMLITLASGMAHFSLPVFIAASFVTRGGRFFLEATLLRHPQAKAIVDRHLTVLAVAGVILIVLALVAVRLIEAHSGG